MKHIMKHAMILLKARPGLPPDQVAILEKASTDLEALADSSRPAGIMEGKFYDIHNAMMEELYEALPEDEEMMLIAEAPDFQGVDEEVNKRSEAIWVRKELQGRFGIPDPLDYEP